LELMSSFGPLAVVNSTVNGNEYNADAPHSNLGAKNFKLEGHKDAITCAKFTPNGKIICSGSRDKHLFIWKGNGECNHLGALNSKSPIIDLVHSNDPETFKTFTAQSTGLITEWDIAQGSQVRRLGNSHSRKHAHKSIVNALSVYREDFDTNVVFSASDDKTIKVWDVRSPIPALEYKHSFEITSISAVNDNMVIFGGLDNRLYCWDPSANKIDNKFTEQIQNDNHIDMLYSLALSPSQNFVLSCSADNSMRAWDLRPFIQQQNGSRCCGHYFMQTSNPDMDIFRCAWSCDERLVGAGSANMLYIYNFKNHRLEYTLPGHQGSVTCCDFSPIDPYVVLSASTDGIIYVSELQA